MYWACAVSVKHEFYFILELSVISFSETDQWTSDEIEKYQQALWKCDKDFFAISKEVNWCFDDIIQTLTQKKTQQ